MNAIVALIELLDRLLGQIPGVRRDLKRKRILRDLLTDGRFEWRSIETLSASIGSSDEKTRELLISIGARRSTGADEVWRVQDR